MIRSTLHTRGISLVEVIVGAAIMLLVVTSLFSAYLSYLRQGLAAVERVQSALLLEEGMEALRIMRDTNWTSKIASLSASTTYRFAFESTWQATTSKSMIDSTFDRTFRLENVSRDSSGVIVSSGGTVDPGTRKTIVSVSYRTPSGTTTRSLSAYLVNIFEN